MPPKRANSKKAQTKVAAAAVASSADAKLSNNGEKEVVEDLATDTENLPNGSSLNDADEAKETAKATTKASTKRSSGRAKNVASELETEAPPVSKKPAAKGGRGKKKSSENEVIENDAQTDVSQDVVEETIAKQNQEDVEEEEQEEVVTKPKGRGGGGKKTEPKAKRASKTKAADSVQEEEPKEAEVETKIPEKKTKAAAGKRKKQAEPVTKADEEIEVKQEVEQKEEEEAVVEKAPKKSSRSSKKSEENPAEKEPQKKKGRAAKKEKVVEKDDEVEAMTAEEEVKVEVKAEVKEKEKKPTKRGRGGAKAIATAEETPAANGDTEEVLPKKRTRKAPSVEKEIPAPEKPKRSRAKKADKAAEKVAEEESASVQGKEEEVDDDDDDMSNGEVKQEKIEDIEESSSSNKKTEKKTEPIAPAAPAAKARGGRKRAAPSVNNKKSTKTAADDNELDDVVDTAEVDDEADVSKPSKSKKTKTAPLNATETKYDKADFELPAAADGQTVEEPRFNLKISSWNVAGLRSWLKKEGLKYLDYEEPDIFCMQETKCTTDQLPEEVVRIPGYHPYWLCMPGGYAGVAIYSKIMPINVEYGIGHKEFDDCGRIITAEYEKFFLINVYVPNSGRKLVNLESRMKWEKLFQEFVQNLDSRKPVVICGDMNVSHQEQDLANPKANTRNAGFTKEERDKMSELLALGYVDTFRHLYPDRKGAYTYWTYMANARSRNVGWRLDYFIVSERFIKRVVDNCIRSQCLGSDHCPITLFLKL